MKKRFLNIGITIICSFLFKSCLFGVGLVEQEIIGDYWLLANGKLHEMSISYDSRIIVEETVFAVGHNKEFIIAKRHPKISATYLNKEITYYHIIKVSKSQKIKKSTDMTYEQYLQKRKELNVPKDLEFDMVFEDLK